MKNFPDHNQFDELERRLRDYTEQPDELVWENIDTALRPDRTSSWFPWVDRFTSVASILLFAFVIGGSSTQSHEQMDSQDVTKVEDSDVMHSKKDVLLFEQKDGKTERSTSSDHTGSVLKPDSKSADVANLSVAQRKGDTKMPATNKDSNATSVTSPSGETPEKSTELVSTNSEDSLSTAIMTVAGDSALKKHDEAESSKRIPKRRHRYYAAVTPSLSFQRAIPVSDEIVVNDFLNSSILSGERFGFSIETGIQGYLAKRWEYYGGISFYRQNQTLKYSYQVNNQVDVEPSDEDGYTVTPKSLEGSINYEMTNLGVQAGVLYNLYGRAKALRHKIGAGVVYQHGLLKTERGQYNNAESSYFSYQIFYRNEVRVGKRWSVFIQPVFTQSFLVREKSDAPFNVKPYRAGIGFGILYDF